MVLILPVFYMDNVLDFTLVPRLAALGIFMFVFGAVFFFRNHDQLSPDLFRNAMFPLLGLMAVVTLLSIVLSTNVREGLFDLVRWLLFSMVVLLAVLIFKDNPRWPSQLAVFSMISALIAVIIGISQYYLLVFLSDQQFLPDGRPMVYKVEGLMSHKNLFSLALYLFMPWIVYGIFILRGFKRIIPVIILVLTFALVVILQTRAVWMGILVAVPVTAVLYMFYFQRDWLRKNLRWVVVCLLLIAVAGTMVVYSVAQHSQNRYVKHFASMVDPSSYQNVNRLKSWSLTIEMISDNLMTGVGAGNWQLEAPKYYPGRFSDREEINWVRPHNDFLWVFAEKGMIGFVLFVAIFVTAIFYLLKVLRSGPPGDKMIALTLMAGLTGYLTASVFDFPYERPFHLAMLALYLAGAVTLWARIRPAAPYGNRITVLPLAFVATGFLFAVYGLLVLRQESLIRKAMDDAAVGNWNAMLVHATSARSFVKNLDPLANPVETYIGKAYEELGNKTEALAAYQKAYGQNPTKLKVLMNLARLLEANGRYDDALQYLDQGLRIIPFHHQLLKQKSDVYYRMERYREALENYKLIAGWDRDSLIRQNIRYLDLLLIDKPIKVADNH